MRRKRLLSASAQKYAYMKRRIRKAQRRAKILGLLYLLATIAITAIACLPLISFTDDTISVKLGVMEFWKGIGGVGSAKQIKNLVIAVIYGLMLLILLINLLRSIFKLGWLFKRKASRTYGFNRNVYAMDDMGKRFSGSFATIVVAHVLILLLAKEGAIDFLAFVLLGIGVFFHFVCGIPAGNVSFFDTENGVEECRRTVGSFSPFVRNLFQLAIVSVLVLLLLNFLDLRSTLKLLFAENGIAQLTADLNGLIFAAIELVMVLLLIGLIRYALSPIEFDPEGSEASGRKRFLWLSVLLLFCAGGMFAYARFLLQIAVEQNVILIAVVALVAVMIELLLVSCPHLETENLDEVDAGTYLTENYNKPGVYINPMPMSTSELYAATTIRRRRR